MTKEIPTTQSRNQSPCFRAHGAFELRHSLVIMVSSFVILPHSCLNSRKSKCSPAICVHCDSRQNRPRRGRAAGKGADAAASPAQFRQTLLGAKFTGLSRRGKYLLFQLRAKTGGKPVTLLGHLGMTGRIYLARKNERPPRHAAVVLDLGGENFIYGTFWPADAGHFRRDKAGAGTARRRF